MTRCASPSLFAGIASFLSAATGGRFRLIIGYETAEGMERAREGAAIVEGAGGHGLVMPRALPAPLTAFSVRMVIADGAVYVTEDSRALVYLGGRAVDRSSEGAPASASALALIDEAAAANGDESSIVRACGGWESVGEGMVGAYVDRAAARITAVAGGAPAPRSVSCADPSGILPLLLDRVGVRRVEEGDVRLVVSSDGRSLTASVPDGEVRAALAEALSSNPALPQGPGLYCVDPAFVLDADALCAGALLTKSLPR